MTREKNRIDGQSEKGRITSQLIDSSAKKDLLSSLSKYEGDIFLYGAGLHANCIVNWYCLPHDIAWVGAAVDDAYYSEGMSFLGKPVQPISALHHRGRPFILIVAMGGMTLAVQRVKSQAFAQMESIITLDASSTFWEDEDLTYERVMSNADFFDSLGDRLADQPSREVLIGFLNARISGDPRHVTKYCVPNQYFPKDLISLSDSEVVYDCGAYAGDTLEDFLAVSDGRFNKYIAIEPETDNVSRLNLMIEHQNIEHVDVIPKRLWDSVGVLRISSKGTCATIPDNGQGAPIEVTTLDQIRRGQGGRCTLLKMDIEGAELRALRGGVR